MKLAIVVLFLLGVGSVTPTLHTLKAIKNALLYGVNGGYQQHGGGLLVYGNGGQVPLYGHNVGGHGGGVWGYYGGNGIGPSGYYGGRGYDNGHTRNDQNVQVVTVKEVPVYVQHPPATGFYNGGYGGTAKYGGHRGFVSDSGQGRPNIIYGGNAATNADAGGEVFASSKANSFSSGGGADSSSISSSQSASQSSSNSNSNAGFAPAPAPIYGIGSGCHSCGGIGNGVGHIAPQSNGFVRANAQASAQASSSSNARGW